MSDTTSKLSTGAAGYAPGLYMRYFVLKPSGNDAYARASRIAMRAYAEAIKDENAKLATEMRDWVDREWMTTPEAQRAGEILNDYHQRRG